MAADCPPAIRQQLRARLRAAFELDGRHPREAQPRLFDSAPRNALLVPFLRTAFPDATFVYVHRQPAASLAESLAIWRAGLAITYPELPNWIGPSWSFLLVPGWQELIGAPLGEIVTEQWVRTMQLLIADLEALPPHQWCVTQYEALRANPLAELNRVLGFVGLAPISRDAPVTEDDLPSPIQAAAQAARQELAPYLPSTRRLADHARDWVAQG